MKLNPECEKKIQLQKENGQMAGRVAEAVR